MSFVVYWIRKASHTDIMSQGYVGVSGNVQKRFAAHRNMENGTNAYLRHAIQKHGWDNMVKSVLLMADKEYCLDIERKLRPADKLGWNLTTGGGYPPTMSGPQPHLRGKPAWNKGKTGVFSKETLERMSKVRLGVSPANKGVPLSAEARKKLSEALKGRVSPRKGVKLPQELVDRVSAKNRGRVQSAEERAMRSKMLKGILKPLRSEQHKLKLGVSAKGRRWYNNGQSVTFCFEGAQPDGYVLGRKSRKFCKEQ